MTREPKVSRDGQTNFLGGVNEGFSPLLIDANQVARGINCSFRGGFPQTRFGFQTRLLTYASAENASWINLSTFEGAGVLDINGVPDIVFSVSGRLFHMGTDWAVTELFATRTTTVTAAFITPPVNASVQIAVADATGIVLGYPITINDGRYIVTAITVNTVTVFNHTGTAGVQVVSGAPVYYADPNDSSCEYIWTEQVEDTLIIQNGLDAALLWNGSTIRRSKTFGDKPEVPTGRQMAFYDSIGRLVVAVDSRTLAVGDILTTTTTNLNFTEEKFLAEGGRFRIPAKYGSITSLIEIASLDSVLGRGPLLIGTSRGIFALNLPVNRLIWKDLETPLLPVALINYGPLGDRSSVNVNGDVFFRRLDGIGSFRMARSEFGTWGNVPVSTEMEPILSRDSSPLLGFSTAALFDNRLLMSVGPRQISPRGCYHEGIISLDLHLISKMGAKAPPAYDGVWSGLKLYQLLRINDRGTERLLAFTKETAGLGLWELSPSAKSDNAGRPTCEIITRSFRGRGETVLEQLVACEIWVDNVVGTVDFDVKYKPDEYPCWFDWGTKTICASEECTTSDETCTAAQTYSAGYKTRFGFGKPPVTDIESECRPSDLGYTFNIRLEWTGRARIKKILVKFAEVDEEPFASCD